MSSKLTYEKNFDGDFSGESYEKLYLKADMYKVSSLYNHPQIRDLFIDLKANVVDLNPALVTKCIQGTEQDFKMLMDKAKEFLIINSLPSSISVVIILELLEILQSSIKQFSKY